MALVVLVRPLERSFWLASLRLVGMGRRGLAALRSILGISSSIFASKGFLGEVAMALCFWWST